MKTMLDKCAVAGDITQAIDRRGAWSCAITVIGGTENTAVKLQSADSAGGEFTDFKTLISADEAEADQYKGFVLDLSGAGNFIKIVGATMATCVLGDCDHDVKNIAITEGEVPSGADLENNKEVEITENGEIEITPSAGKDGMKKVTATVNVPSSAKEEQTKSVTITENGTTTVTPDSGKTLSSVSITTNVSGGGSEEIHQIVVSDVINQGTSQSFSFGSSWDNSSFQYITMGSNIFKTGVSSAIGKITREQILGASSGDKFSLTDGTLTLTLTISSAYESEGVIFVEGSFTGSGYAMGAGSPYVVYVF